MKEVDEVELVVARVAALDVGGLGLEAGHGRVVDRLADQGFDGGSMWT